MGGNDKNYYLHKASEYYGIGRLNKEGKFDWDYYKLNTFLNNTKNKKFIIITIENKQYVAEIKNKIKKDGKLKCFIPDLNYYKNITIKDVYNTYSAYESYEKAKYYTIRRFNDV